MVFTENVFVQIQPFRVDVVPLDELRVVRPNRRQIRFIWAGTGPFAGA